MFSDFINKLNAYNREFVVKLCSPCLPIINFPLNNMIKGSHYPIEKTEKFVGVLPFSFEDGPYETLSRIFEHKLVKH